MTWPGSAESGGTVKSSGVTRMSEVMAVQCVAAW